MYKLQCSFKDNQYHVSAFSFQGLPIQIVVSNLVSRHDSIELFIKERVLPKIHDFTVTASKQLTALDFTPLSNELLEIVKNKWGVNTNLHIQMSVCDNLTDEYVSRNYKIYRTKDSDKVFPLTTLEQLSNETTNQAFMQIEIYDALTLPLKQIGKESPVQALAMELYQSIGKQYQDIEACLQNRQLAFVLQWIPYVLETKPSRFCLEKFFEDVEQLENNDLKIKFTNLANQLYAMNYDEWTCSIKDTHISTLANEIINNNSIEVKGFISRYLSILSCPSTYGIEQYAGKDEPRNPIIPEALHPKFQTLKTRLLLELISNWVGALKNATQQSKMNGWLEDFKKPLLVYLQECESQIKINHCLQGIVNYLYKTATGLSIPNPERNKLLAYGILLNTVLPFTLFLLGVGSLFVAFMIPFGPLSTAAGTITPVGVLVLVVFILAAIALFAASQYLDQKSLGDKYINESKNPVDTDLTKAMSNFKEQLHSLLTEIVNTNEPSQPTTNAGVDNGNQFLDGRRSAPSNTGASAGGLFAATSEAHAAGQPGQPSNDRDIVRSSSPAPGTTTN